MTVASNDPALWLAQFPNLKAEDHKYDRGMAVIYGAPKMTGATRLAAMACARIGAGLVKVIAPPGTADIYRSTLPAHIIVEDDSDSALTLLDERVKAWLIGPGWSLQDGIARKDILQLLVQNNENGLVLDAGAFLTLRDHTIPRKNLVVTPHEGEFSQVFHDITGDKISRAEQVAKRIGGVVVLKGNETVISDAGGASVINSADSPNLATAGTGDVLAGMITGLVAQAMPVFEASCAAVWIHAEAARRFGKGLVASDLPDLIPAVLQGLSR